VETSFTLWTNTLLGSAKMKNDVGWWGINTIALNYVTKSEVEIDKNYLLQVNKRT
jgi:hypothetical protein